MTTVPGEKGPVGTSDGGNQGQFEQKRVEPGNARQDRHDENIDRDSHGCQGITTEVFISVSTVALEVHASGSLIAGSKLKWRSSTPTLRKQRSDCKHRPCKCVP